MLNSFIGRCRPLASLLAVLTVVSLSQGISAQTAKGTKLQLDGISFASKPGCLFVSIKEFASQLDKAVSVDPETDAPMINGVELEGVKHLFDGTGIMPVSDARGLGATVEWDGASKTANVAYNSKQITVKDSDKTVIVDKSQQALMAYQGSHLVLLTRVSTGREGHGTPNGAFTAGPAKERMHRSRLYNFAPMPYSVQVAGNVFIHGYTSVPDRPASHGCIRMPLTGSNPARYFYNWVDIGTPVTIKGVWSYRYASHRHHRSRFSRYAMRHRRHRTGFRTRFAVAHGTRTNGWHTAKQSKAITTVPVVIERHFKN